MFAYFSKNNLSRLSKLYEWIFLFLLFILKFSEEGSEKWKGTKKINKKTINQKRISLFLTNLRILQQQKEKWS